MISLYINPLTPTISVRLLEDGEVRQIFDMPAGNDFEHFPEMITHIIDTASPDEVWVITGPWAFTRMRIVTLTLSTLVLSKGIILKGCHFFDLIGDEHIPLLRANDSEYLTRDENKQDTLKTIDLLLDGIYIGYDTKNNFTDGKVFIEYKESWGNVWEKFSSLDPSKWVSPVYIKTPHITWSKKSISPSWEKTKK